MDHQDLIPRRTSAGFKHLLWSDVDVEDREWLLPIVGLRKVAFEVMLKNLEIGKWDLWRLPKPARGVAVTYPLAGQLFIYYLHGHRLFDTLTRENLLAAAKAEGLSGCAAETGNKGVLKLLKKAGFHVWFEDKDKWCVELRDGR